MHFSKYLWTGVTLIISGSLAFAHEGPCKQVKEACEKAGFVKGAAKEGKGLWKDCIEPLMQGTPSAKKGVLPLPNLDKSIVEACKEKHKNFSAGKTGH